MGAITAPDQISGNTAGIQASVPRNQSLTYHWTVLNGLITAGEDASEVTFTTGNEQDVSLFCRGTDGAGNHTIIKRTLPCVPAAGISRFEVKPTLITQGGSAQLGWAAVNAKKVTLDPGAADLTQLNGPSYEVKPTETTTYKLTVVNSIGGAVTKQVVLKVVPPPAIQSLAMEGSIEFGKPGNLVATFSGGKAEIRGSGGVSASSATSPLTVQVTPEKDASFTVTVTNEAGLAVTHTLDFHSEALPPAPKPAS
jgi:hypothetical protein